MTEFNPQALHGLDLALTDDSSIVEVDGDEVRRIASAETRRRCAGVKLASRIVGMASAMSGDLDDVALLRSMEGVMKRVAAVRQAALSVLGVQPDATDFSASFNALTNVALDVVTEEWKWSRLAPGEARSLSASLLVKLFEQGIQQQESSYTEGYASSSDLALARKLCMLEAIPKLFGVINFFDYYQADREAMVFRLLGAVVDEAEKLAQALTPEDAITFTKQAILQRLYGVSAAIMCEVYKEQAARDVMQLRSMANLDRSVAVTQYERLGGMKYDHVIEAHAKALNRVGEMSELIFESQQRR